MKFPFAAHPSLSRRFFSGLALSALFFTVSLVHGAEVTASIRPQSFSVTDAAQLSLTFEGASPDSRPTPPAVDGLTIRPYGQSSNTSIINGEVTRSVSLTYIVTAEKAGEYVIPAFDIKAGGTTLSTQAVQFSVLDAAPLPAPAPSNPAGSGAGTGSGSAANSQSSNSSDSDRFGFLRVEFPKRERDHVYVGEMAPIRIKAYFPADSRVSLTSAPRPEGQGFTLHRVSEKPQQSEETIDGKSYRVVTWYGGVSFVKAGEFPVSLSLNANVAVRQQKDDRKSTGQNRGRRSRSPFGGNSPFDDPFFDQFFGGKDPFADDFFDDFFTPMVQREITLTSPGAPLDIQALPLDGRPDDFSGAVGDFKLGSYQLPADAHTGEPQEIHVTVEGAGNFDRMAAPHLSPADAWKSYDPKSTFKAGDVASFSGSKSFQFNAVPRKGGDQPLSLNFSFFNPDTQSYQSISTDPIQLTVSGDDVHDHTASAQAPVEPAAKTANPPVSQLAPLRPPSSSRSSLRPLIATPGFWSVTALAGLLIFGSLIYSTWHRRHNDPRRLAEKQRDRQIHHALRNAEQAAQTGDATAFFEASRRAIQTRLASLWSCPPESITLADLRSRLPQDSPALELFARADALAYNANPQADTNRTDLAAWRDKLQHTLDSLS